jgi:hypothetical protein
MLKYDVMALLRACMLRASPSRYSPNCEPTVLNIHDSSTSVKPILCHLPTSRPSYQRAPESSSSAAVPDTGNLQTYPVRVGCAQFQNLNFAKFLDSPAFAGAFFGPSETAHQRRTLILKASTSSRNFWILAFLSRFMAAQGLSRKRPAPGTSPPSYQQQMQSAANSYNAVPIPQLSDEQFLQLGYNAQQPSSFSDASAYNNAANNFGGNGAQPSNQLTRRPMNQLASRNRTYNDSNGLQWVDSANANGQQLDSAWNDDIEALEQKAQTAKKIAQEKRKQIPPFVQKLSR